MIGGLQFILGDWDNAVGWVLNFLPFYSILWDFFEEGGNTYLLN